MQLRRDAPPPALDGGFEFLEDDGGDVLDRGIEGAEFLAVDVEVLVVEAVQNGVVDDSLELVDGEEAAGGVGGAGEGDFEFVVVAVAVAVVAAAEEFLVLGVGERGGVEAVGGGEFEFEGELDHVGLLDGERQVGAEVEGERVECVGEEFLAEVFEEVVEQGGCGVWRFAEVTVAEGGEGVLAEDFVDDFDVDEHSGGAVDAAGEGGGEGEEGGDVEESGLGGEGVRGIGRGGLRGFVEGEADFAGEFEHAGIVAGRETGSHGGGMTNDK